MLTPCLEIEALKLQKRSLSKELETDNRNLSRVKAEIAKRREMLEKKMAMIRNMEQKKDGYDDLVVQGEEALTKIAENSQRIMTSIDNYCDDNSNKF